MRRNNEAFTIVELLVVITLTVLLVGVSGGLYAGSYKRRLLERTAREMLLAAQYARITAIETHRECVFRFDAANNGFYLIRGNATNSDREEKVIKNRFSSPFRFQDKIEFRNISIQSRKVSGSARYQRGSEQALEVVFFPNGTAETAAITIGLASGDSRACYTLMISAATGRAKLIFGLPDKQWDEVTDLDR